MTLCRVILLFGIIFSLLADVSFSALNVTLPIVDLGYELHQATFNVSIVLIQVSEYFIQFLYSLVIKGIRTILQLLQYPLRSASGWKSTLYCSHRTNWSSI
jgi:hypothetical protein